MENKITIGFTGDVMIGRGVGEAISHYGYIYPWGNILPYLRSTDVNIVNLESTLTNSNQKRIKVFNFKSAPDKVNALVEARISAVNIANNHILDFSEAGLMETIHTLENVNIKYCGAGLNEEQAASPAILRIGDFRIGMLGYTDNEPTWRAGTHECGINHIRITKPEDRQRALLATCQLNKEADIVIVSIHWGPNMQERPETAFIEFAHDLIDEGADIIHGHSAHIFQGIEIFKNKLILYDTGDFVDDYRVDKILRNDLSFFFRAEIGLKKILRLQLIPVCISNCQVNRLTDDTQKWGINRMQLLSKEFGTQVTNMGEVIFPS